MADLPPLTVSTLFTAWDFPPTWALLVVPVALYLWAAARTEGWRVRETVAFLAGIAVAVVAVGGSVNAYSRVLFVMHMAQHLMLIMVVPTLVILGRPLELVRRVTPNGLRSRLGRLARGRVVALITHPLTAFVGYVAVVVGTHLTGFQQLALSHQWVHGFEEMLYLASGYLLLLPVLGTEAVRRNLPHLMRLVLLLVSMVVDTVVGLTLLMTGYEPFPAYAAVARYWGPTPVDDLHWGGATMWIGGDLLMAVLAVVVIGRWVSSSSSELDLGPWLESARRSAIGQGVPPEADLDDEQALAAYNAMLSRLSDPRASR